MSPSTQLMIIGVCMILEAFFSGMETGVISIHRLRLRHSVMSGSKAAKILSGYLENTDRLLGTTLVGTNICVVMISVVSASLAVRLMGSGGQAVATLLTAVTVLVFCEYLPKAWFHSKPLERCSRFAKFLRMSERIVHPLSVAILGVVRLFVPGATRMYSKSDPFITKEELKTLAWEGAKSGVLSSKESTMIHRVLELSGERADDIMIPSNEMTAVFSGATVKEFLELCRTSGFTRMPVHDDAAADFVGIINVYYVLSHHDLNYEMPIASFVRSPLLIPAGMPVDEIFPRLRRSRQPMCLVKDSEGDVIGLITTHDILEEIVGEL
ncbi:MAG: CNNM domain-containing protein [Kiritimatiellia bacterium]|nr:CNNM domain-containing protein [Kiritimatiellia bacterium]MDP6847799.1 CNNM domain-containing protein [Kiritimatiellia bacterium]